jgi:hypothetical protein
VDADVAAVCHQAIFVNDASGAIAPSEAEVVQVGDAIGQRAKRRGLVQGAVRPVSARSLSCLAVALRYISHATSGNHESCLASWPTPCGRSAIIDPVV